MTKPYNPHDKWMMRAKDQGYRARSVYKLMEINNQFNLFKPGISVLDLAAAPGSWLQFISEKIGKNGFALGIDLKPIDPIGSNVTTKVADITNLTDLQYIISELGLNKFDVIVSDVAPNTSGIAYADHMRSLELNRAIIDVAKEFLKPGGKLVMKVFQGEKMAEFVKDLHKAFKKVSFLKAEASRDRSKEIYVVCLK